MVSLRLVEDSDLPLIEKWEKDPVVYNFYNRGEELTPVRDLADLVIVSTEEVLIIEIDSTPVGLVKVFYNKSPSASIVYYIGESQYRSRGYGPRLISTIISYLEDKQIEYIHASVNEVNFPSWKSLERVGFKFCGIWTRDSKLILDGKPQFFDRIKMEYTLHASVSRHMEALHFLIHNHLDMRMEEYESIMQKL